LLLAFERSNRTYVQVFNAYVHGTKRTLFVSFCLGYKILIFPEYKFVFIVTMSLGINEYLRKCSSQFPLEFTILGITPSEWHIQDVLALGRLSTHQNLDFHLFYFSQVLFHFTANCKNVVRFEKTRLPLISSLLFPHTKQKQLFNCLKCFLLNDIFLKNRFCLKWDFTRSQSSKRTTFLQFAVRSKNVKLIHMFFFCSVLATYSWWSNWIPTSTSSRSFGSWTCPRNRHSSWWC
jgi:hypothetical protein